MDTSRLRAMLVPIRTTAVQAAIDAAAPPTMAATTPTISPISIVVIVLGAAGIGYLLWSRFHKPAALGDATLDREMARKSLREEREAIRAYTQRLRKAESPRLKKALRHARKEEREHAASFLPLTGPNMLKVIAEESRSPEEFARRAEAWASTEATPPSITKMAAAYRRAKGPLKSAMPWNITKLIREARETRLAQTRARWKGYMTREDDEEYAD